jgi:hypothetical protein
MFCSYVSTCIHTVEHTLTQATSTAHTDPSNLKIISQQHTLTQATQDTIVIGNIYTQALQQAL